MERVHFQQEQMLPELKDLVERNLFTEKEIKQIIKQRTVFEAALVRRVAKKSDYIRYISYEMDLEKLRRKRIERMDLPKAPSSISDYAFVRRQFLIFERALKRFKSDLGLWTQYIQVAKREGARALVGRVTARALQLHPTNPAFYILAASHELDNHSPSTARSLLQRGIRLNPDSVDLWSEYVKMEMGFVEGLRRRWEVLGIKAFDAPQKGKEKASESSDISGFLEQDEDDIVMGSIPASKEGATAVEVEEGAEGRRQIMEGAIVKSVIQNAAQALPKVDLFVALDTVIAAYPSPPSLQASLLEYLYSVWGETLPQDPKSVELRAQRFLKSKEGVELVEGLRKANEEMVSRIGNSGDEALLEVYAQFLEKWYSKDADEHLRTYLISSLKQLLQKTKTSPSLLAAHIKLLMKTPTIPPAKVRRMAQKYTSQVPRSSRVWLARLEAEKALVGEGGEEAVLSAWAEARRAVADNAEEARLVWLWGVDSMNKGDLEARKALHEELLRESLGTCSGQGLHEVLLMNYVTLLEEGWRGPLSGVTSDQPHGGRKWKRLDAVRHMGNGYLTTGRVWQRLFGSVAGGDEGESGDTGTEEKGKVLEEIYEYWRQKDGVGARAAWAEWLLSQGKGVEASSVIVQGGASLCEEARAELERLWIEIVEKRQ